MPIKTNKVRLSTYRNYKIQKTSKQNDKVTKKEKFLLNQLESSLFSKQEKKQIKHYNGKNILINANINRFDSFIFSTLDLLNPFIRNHPNFEKKVIKFSELLIKTNKRYFSKAK